jgi:phage-related protein
MLKADILLIGCIINDTVIHVPRLFPAIFFETETGREPVREWLQDLPKAERKIIGVDIMTVQFRWPPGMPLVRNIGSGIHEIRSTLPTRIARTLFFVHEGEMVLLHGFIKKTRKTPNEDRALALRRKNAYIKSSKT